MHASAAVTHSFHKIIFKFKIKHQIYHTTRLLKIQYNNLKYVCFMTMLKNCICVSIHWTFHRIIVCTDRRVDTRVAALIRYVK